LPSSGLFGASLHQVNRYNIDRTGNLPHSAVKPCFQGLFDTRGNIWNQIIEQQIMRNQPYLFYFFNLFQIISIISWPIAPKR